MTENPYQIHTKKITNFEDTNLKFGTYIRLKSLHFGDIIFLQDNACDIKVIVIGNGTPYNGLTSIGDEGWNWKVYDTWRVIEVHQMTIETGIPLSNYDVQIVKERLASGMV